MYPESLPHPFPTTPNHCEMWYNSGTVWSLLPAEHEHPLPLQPNRVKTTAEKEKTVQCGLQGDTTFKELELQMYPK